MQDMQLEVKIISACPIFCIARGIVLEYKNNLYLNNNGHYLGLCSSRHSTYHHLEI